jgi:hypothetical protein
MQKWILIYCTYVVEVYKITCKKLGVNGRTKSVIYSWGRGE